MNQVIMRPKKPPRPKSEVFLDREDGPRRKRLSAFGGDSPYGRLDAYIKLEQLGEGSYATVFKGFSNLTKQVRLAKGWGTSDLNPTNNVIVLTMKSQANVKQIGALEEVHQQ